MSEPTDTRRQSAPLWLAVAALQVATVAGLTFAWDDDVDSTATTVDWAFVALILATPAALAVSWAAGWWLRRRTGPPGSWSVRLIGAATHWGTAALLVPAALLALPLVAMSVFVEPIG